MNNPTPIDSVPHSSNPVPETPALSVDATAVPPARTETADVMGPTQCVVNPLQLPDTRGLSSEQRTALCALASGMTATAAAELAGVDRSTLYRWRKIDNAFVVALNAWREQTQEIAQNQLIAMTQLATSNIYASLRRGDVRTALVLLKSLGTLAPEARKEIKVDKTEQILATSPRELARRLGYELIPDPTTAPEKRQTT